VNYIEWHIGDWVKQTHNLKKPELAIYLLLVLDYYVQEGPFPDDMEEVYRSAKAETPADRKATDYVVRKFFKHVPGTGYTHNRCDEELHRFRQKVPKAETKKENDRERQERARARRKELFAKLRAKGITAPWDTTTAELEAALSRAQSQTGSEPVTGPVTRDNTASSHQSPVTSLHSSGDSYSESARAGAADAERARPDWTQAARNAAAAMKGAGLGHVDAGDAKLIALLEQGMTVAELTSAAQAAAARKKGFAWALARAEGKRQDAGAQPLVNGAPPGEWWDSRSGIEAMAVKLGLGKWVQSDPATGRTDHWPDYLARVMKAAKEAGERCSTDT
jgi:uncharacterized protein YdaU (DUF1376 family)